MDYSDLCTTISASLEKVITIWIIMRELKYGLLSMFSLIWLLNDYCPCDKELLFWSSFNMIKIFCLFLRVSYLLIILWSK